MAFHLLLLLPKLKLFAFHGVSSSSSNSFITTLLCLFILKIPFIRFLRRDTYSDMFDASRLFIFRLSRIIFEHEPTAINGQRWARAVRLVGEWVRRPSSSTIQSSEDSFHVVSMLAL